MSNSDVMTKLNNQCYDVASKVQETGGAIEKMAGTAAFGVGSLVSKAVSNLKSEVDRGDNIACSRLSGLGKDFSKVIKANPVPTILIAVGLGWFASSLLKR